MPIKPENTHRYPEDWNEIRQEVLRRAGHRCEKCGVENYALGGRTREGVWLPAFPLGEKLLRLEWPKPGDRALCGHRVGEAGKDACYVGEELRIVRIVLTIAHKDHVPENVGEPGNRPNLAAWCQRCHLAYDHEHHMRNAHETRRSRKAGGDLFT